MKTIIIGLNWLGDIIMSFPAIMAAAGSGEVHIITRPHLAQVYHLADLPVKIHQVATNANPVEVIRQLQPLRKLKADNIIVLPDSLRAAIIAKLCKSSISTGFATQFRSWLLTNAVKKPDNFVEMHESELHFRLIKEAGLTQLASTPELKPNRFQDGFFVKLADRLGLEPDHDYMVLAPGAAFGAAKRWPPAKFSQLAGLLASHFGLPLLVTGSLSENQIVEEICRNSSARLINAAGKTDLHELACLLSHARALIANDSGTMHLAALYATPTIVPVGPTDMVRTGPLNGNFSGVYSAENCPKAPCRQRTCPLKNHVCMESIAPQAVFAA
ncbi:MAG: lipopolysaccharide heptosyltransferase II, partial [Candidatus Riflebacteria bacterium]|nr:lipopolysaccharide heptosyltransferase II [Candidatus Riflebacteria bacterium]